MTNAMEKNTTGNEYALIPIILTLTQNDALNIARTTAIGRVDGQHAFDSLKGYYVAMWAHSIYLRDHASSDNMREAFQADADDYRNLAITEHEKEIRA